MTSLWEVGNPASDSRITRYDYFESSVNINGREYAAVTIFKLTQTGKNQLYGVKKTNTLG